MSHIAAKVVVVTGAGSGFGRLVSERAAARGAQVVCSDVDAQTLDATVSAIQEAGGAATGQAADVTDLAAMRALVARAVESYGRVDVMLNNAGVMPLAFYADHEAAAPAWDRCIDINFKGVLHGMIAVHDQMMAQGRGHVVNVSSIYGNFPVAGAGVYGATKAAVNVLSESLRVESQGRIKVTVIKPTGVPATNLSAGVINPEAVVGILGHNAAAYGEKLAGLATGDVDPALLDENNVGYAVLAPEHIADQIIYAIDQPWGVSLGDITIRASGDGYIL